MEPKPTHLSQRYAVQFAEQAVVQAYRHRPYALAVAAESLHWADWALALPAIARALSPGARLVLLDRAEQVPWESELGALVARHSTNRDYVPYDLVEELTRRGLFVEEGRRTTAPVRYTQTVEDYIESFHSRNGFSRARMNAQAARDFDEGVSSAVQPHLENDMVPLVTRCELVWGRP
jgi:hypothetical protein